MNVTRTIMAVGVVATMLDGLVCASEVGIYGIVDPNQRLEAIRAAWPHAHYLRQEEGLADA